MTKSTAKKGSENNPIHQSDLTTYQHAPTQQNATWAKTALGSAIHNIIKAIADKTITSPHATPTTPPTFPSLEQEFNKAIQELQLQGKHIIYTKEDLHSTTGTNIYEKKQKHKKYLLDAGKTIIRKVKQLINFNKLSIVGTELAFKFQFPTTTPAPAAGKWFAGSADLIITVHPDRFTPRIKKPEHFYSATTNIPELDYKPTLDPTSPFNPALHIDELPIIWDYKTTITPLPLSSTFQHHIYSLAAKHGFWTRKAVYNTDEHSLDFSKCDDWFFFNTFAPFYYVYLWGLTSKTSPSASGGITVNKPKRLQASSKQQRKIHCGTNPRQEMFQYAFPGMELKDAAQEAEALVVEALKEYVPE